MDIPNIKNTLTKYVDTAITKAKVSLDSAECIRNLEDVLKPYVESRIAEYKASSDITAKLDAIREDLDQLGRRVNEICSQGKMAKERANWF